MGRLCWWLLALLLVGTLSACQGKGTPTPAPTAATTATAMPLASSPQPTIAASAEEIETVRKLAFAYWEAFNSYDADRTLAYLAEPYRKQREETIRSQIRQIKLFRVKLGLTEETAPVFMAPDQAEMMLTMKEPLGTRRIKMQFQRESGTWLITQAEEIK